LEVLLAFALLIGIGLVAGFLAATILGERRRYGLFGYVVVGAIGAIAGRYAFKSLGFPVEHWGLVIVPALAGSLVLVLFLRLLRR
jgi:uncharacterized membrane protein YeaQ/YmgE (transglycosylase-associated protein family)